MNELKKKLVSYTNDFVQEEEGMELLQVAVVVALSAGLIAVIAFLFTKVGQKIGEAGDQVDALDTNTTVDSNPYNSQGSSGTSTNTTP